MTMSSGVLILLLLLSVADDAAREPAALVLAVEGNVEVRPAAGAPVTPRPKDLLYPGDVVATPAGGSAVLAFLGDGARERIKGGAAVTVGRGGCSPADAVERRGPAHPAVVRALRGVKPAGAGRTAAVVFRSELDAPANPPAVTPIVGATVLTDRPTLSWPAREGVEEYRIRLTIGGSGRVIWTATATGSQLPYPEGAEPLQRLRNYDWQVTDARGRAIASGRFTVASAGRSAELAGLAGLAKSDDPADVQAAALAYEAAGVLDAALAAYEQLVKLEPDQEAHRESLAALQRRAGRAEPGRAPAPGSGPGGP